MMSDIFRTVVVTSMVSLNTMALMLQSQKGLRLGDYVMATIVVILVYINVRDRAPR